MVVFKSSHWGYTVISPRPIYGQIVSPTRRDKFGFSFIYLMSESSLSLFSDVNGAQITLSRTCLIPGSIVRSSIHQRISFKLRWSQTSYEYFTWEGERRLKHPWTFSMRHTTSQRQTQGSDQGLEDETLRRGDRWSWLYHAPTHCSSIVEWRLLKRWVFSGLFLQPRGTSSCSSREFIKETGTNEGW